MSGFFRSDHFYLLIWTLVVYSMGIGVGIYVAQP